VRHQQRGAAPSFAEALRRSVKSEVRMVPGVITVDGRKVRFAVSDNVAEHGPGGPGTPPIWAVNIHGFFAGGGVYWRESARLAEALGWRVVNPSLPGFGGSDSLPWDHLSMAAVSEQVTAVSEHVGAGPAVLLGHSMGGAVAVQYAARHPERALGIIYRDGVGTPAWRKRGGPIPAVMAPFLPDVAAFADLVFSVAIDFPDLFMGRAYSTMRAVLPDVRRNVRAFGRTIPVGGLLTDIDQRELVGELVAQGEIPFLPIWGIFDRIAHWATADEVERSSGVEVLWVPGGHSWMLARPQGQGDILRVLHPGRQFVTRVEARWRLLHGIQGRTRGQGVAANEGPASPLHVAG
jgi:pimeloyl-ACP methyl ester carboxylesterase